MFDTFKYAISIVTNEWSKSYIPLDDQIEHIIKLTSISLITVISIPFVVSFDIGIELGNQCIARCSSIPVSIPEPAPAPVLRRSARLAAKRALLQ